MARERIDYGKPGDPSGCYFPAEWRRPKPKAAQRFKELCSACWLDIDPAQCGSEHCPKRNAAPQTQTKAEGVEG